MRESIVIEYYPYRCPFMITLSFCCFLTYWHKFSETFSRVKYNPRGDSAYERGGDARRKFGIKPLKLKETDLGVAQAFFGP